MPTYEFVNKKTKKIEEYVMSISAYDQFKVDNPHLQRYYSDAPTFSYTGSGDLSGKKADGGWKETLQKIAEQNPRSPLADQVLRKDIKRVKTDQILEKHRKKQAAQRRGK